MTSFILQSILLANLITPKIPVFDMEKVLAQLAYCESSNNPKAYRADDGGSPSIGLYQFKQKTWDWAVKRYHIDFRLATSTKLIPVIDIWNPEYQRMVAREMLKEKRFSHWRTCSRKLGLERFE